MSTDETKARLRGLVERGRQDYAQKWDFDERSEIAGVVESIEKVTFTGDNGEPKPVYVATVRDEFSGERLSIWLSQAALFNKFRDLGISPGELVYVRYLGESDTHEKGRSPAKRFRVEVDREGTKFDWGKEGPSSQLPASPPVMDTDGPEDLSEEEHEAAMAAYAAAAPGDDDIPF